MALNIEKLKEDIALVLEVDKDLVNEDTAVGNPANWDSLRHIELAAMLEDKYALEINSDTIVKIMTFKGICNCLGRIYK